MERKDVKLRPAQERDRAAILRMNEENVEVLSPMDAAKLTRFEETADLLLVAEVDGETAAFLIALREGVAGYESENYRWFARERARFLYIDRVVIDAPYRGLGIGRLLYQAVFARARATGVPSVTAEIDTVPYNGPSLQFHAALGFREIGTQTIRGGAVTVSLQEAAVETDQTR